MADPTPDRIDAALALAEAYNDWNMGKDLTSDRLVLAWKAYRATAPKPLRTRAEVDAEIATIVRMGFDSGSVHVSNPGGTMDEYLLALCAEPTADPEPARDELNAESVRVAAERFFQKTIADGDKQAIAWPQRSPDCDYCLDSTQPLGRAVIPEQRLWLCQRCLTERGLKSE